LQFLLTILSRDRHALILERRAKVLSLAKEILNRSFELDLDTYLHLERSSQALVSSTDDSQEGIAAFREHREPKFEGR